MPNFTIYSYFTYRYFFTIKYVILTYLLGDSDVYVGMMSNDTVDWKWVSYNFGLEDGVSFVYCQDMSESPPTFRIALSPYISPSTVPIVQKYDRYSKLCLLFSCGQKCVRDP